MIVADGTLTLYSAMTWGWWTSVKSEYTSDALNCTTRGLEVLARDNVSFRDTENENLSVRTKEQWSSCTLG